MNFRFTKEDFGKLILPEKIFSFNYKKELKTILGLVKSDSINYLIIANLFFISQILTLITFIFSYEPFFIFFKESLLSSPAKKFFYIYIFYLLLSFIWYFIVLFFYLFRFVSRYKKDQEEIEKDLPDFIDALVSNIKGGVSLEKSFLQSVRSDQKVLKKEVILINERILMGETALEALDSFKKRYPQSEILSRTIFLISEGISGGGDLAKPLERISANLKKIYLLNEEIKGSASGFTIIIRAISIMVAPLLFALAITLLSFIGDLFSLLSEVDTSVFGNINGIPREFTLYLIVFSYAMIFLITFFSSLITSQLKNEKSYEAIKYLPIYIFIALFLYNIFKNILLGFFGGILG
jgi:pilus assembly protein TadC